MSVVTIVYFSDLRTHQLDAHDDQTFADNLHINADFSYFFSPGKSQTSGRPIAELFKFALFTAFGNSPVFFHLATVALHLLASLLLALLYYRIHNDLPLALLTYPALLVLASAAHASALFLIPFCLYWAHQRGLALRGSWLWALLTAAIMLPITLIITAHTTTTWAAIGNRMGQGLFDAIVDMGELYLWFAGRLLTTAHWLPIKIYALESWEIYPRLSPGWLFSIAPLQAYGAHGPYSRCPPLP